MSDEHFLTRWSRRKRAAATEPVAPAKSDDAAVNTPVAARDETATPARDATAAPPQPAPAAFDPASLPSLDSITEGTDVRGFLGPGVPPGLTREALRRAWSADPAIRDFVGLQEYDFDFHTPGAIAGFGELGGDVDVKKMVARIFGENPEGEPAAAAESVVSADTPTQPVRRTSESGAREDRAEGQAAASLSHGDGQADPRSGTGEPSTPTVIGQQPEELVHRNKEIALQQDNMSDNEGQKRRRPHGGALPKT